MEHHSYIHQQACKPLLGRRTSLVAGTNSDHTLLRRSSGGGASKLQQVRLACIIVSCILACISITGWSTNSSAKRDHEDTEQQNASTTAIEDLQQKQDIMLKMLKNITAGRLGGAHLALPSQTLASAKAGSITRSVLDVSAEKQVETISKSSPQTEAAASGNLSIPAALAAVPMLTKLHDAVLRQTKSYEYNRKTAIELLDKLVHLPAADAQVTLEQQLDGRTLEPLTQYIYELYKLILASGRYFPCREDTTLSLADLPVGNDIKGGNISSQSAQSNKTGTLPRYYFAANLRDNSMQLPHYTLSLLQTLLRIPRDSAFVSVYESNSEDGVHGWIDVMKLTLDVIGAHNRVVARGMLVRNKQQDRIQFLAQVRNMAMNPLYNYYAGLEHNRGGGDNSVLPGGLPWEPDYIVFINDVYFCWGMVIRLMNHKADITCGTDWWQNKDATSALTNPLKNKLHRPKPTIPEEYRLEAPILDNPLSLDQTNPIVFYDVWVARDVSGQKFWWTYPFVSDEVSAAAFSKGLPFRASCCWNGLAVLRASPFKDGLKFRMHQEGECRASECSLLCEDFARLGYHTVVVDPGVQLAYDWSLAREMMAVGIEGVGQSTWAEVKAAGVSQLNRPPDYSNMECCSLRPGSEWVSFYSDCSKRDVLHNNFTRGVVDL